MDSRTNVLLLAAAAIVLGACAHGPAPDAYGNFEATEVVVSAQTAGQLLSFGLTEGDTIAPGAVVALVDTTQLALQTAQLAAQREASASQVHQVADQLTADGLHSVLLVSDPYHAERIKAMASELGLHAYVSSTRTSPVTGFAAFRHMLKEAAGVAAARVVGWDRLTSWTE